MSYKNIILQPSMTESDFFMMLPFRMQLMLNSTNNVGYILLGNKLPVKLDFTKLNEIGKKKRMIIIKPQTVWFPIRINFSAIKI